MPVGISELLKVLPTISNAYESIAVFCFESNVNLPNSNAGKAKVLEKRLCFFNLENL